MRVFLFLYLGVSIPKPFIDSYNSTNGTCPVPDFLGQYTGIGDICPTAHYCPGQIDRPLACLPGTYNNERGQSKCKDCPAGHFCPTKTENFVKNTCPEGYYCLNNTRFARQYPCPEGTYNSLPG